MSKEQTNLEESPNFIDYWHDVTNSINHLVSITWAITRDKIQKEHGAWTTEEQIFKIIEECIEYQKELMKAKYVKADWEKMDNENLDILFAWLSLQHITHENGGVDKFRVAESLKKFHKRGWLKFEDIKNVE